ncbi:MAG: hydroxymethylglutaryl-CoA lyase [Candidatus Nanopelagicaceae bacterium]|nr:hydroxymethylglutaryl-CoA lyase [Candidatus Nanopelagicaceae bacterium]
MATIEICDVSPRDGLQNEDTLFSFQEKVELVERAVNAGVRRIEVTSFVNPQRVPQMADAEEVMAALPRLDGVRYSGLVMNARGLDRALVAKVHEVNIVVVATDTFCGKNQGMTTQQSIQIASDLVTMARDAGVASTVTIGAAFGCPFEGEVPIERLREVITRVVDAGPDELALADTIGVAIPQDIVERFGIAREYAPQGMPLRIHLHDTRHTAVANAVAALSAGVTVLDASIGGMGGCPFAPNATGNVATEDLLYLFNRMNIETGIDLDQIIETTAWLEGKLKKNLPGALLRAGQFPKKT